MTRLWIGLGALAGLLAVAMAAVAAHLVANQTTRDIVQSGVEIQGWHALALLATGLWAPHGGRLADLAGAAFVLGLLAFCGALYLLAFAGLHTAPLAPAGGVLLMVGWALLGLSAIRARK